MTDRFIAIRRRVLREHRTPELRRFMLRRTGPHAAMRDATVGLACDSPFHRARHITHRALYARWLRIWKATP